MVALGTAVVLTSLIVMAFITYSLLALKITATKNEMAALFAREQRRLKAEVDRVSHDGANTKIMAQAAVYTAQRVEEKVLHQKPIVLVVPAPKREANDTAPVTIIECEADDGSEES